MDVGWCDHPYRFQQRFAITEKADSKETQKQIRPGTQTAPFDATNGHDRHTTPHFESTGHFSLATERPGIPSSARVRKEANPV
jgi:hypothetical protein